MNILKTKQLLTLCASTLLLVLAAGGSTTALAKKAVFKIAVDGGKGGMIRLTKKKITYTCKAAQGCDAPSIDDLGSYLAETLPDSDFEVGGYAIKDLVDRPIESLTTFNVATLRKYKNQDVKLVVIFRKKPFPIKVSVVDGVGGTVVGENNSQCSTSSDCTFQGFGVDDLVNLSANPADGWELEKWSISDLINTGLNKEFKDLKLIRIKQTRNGFRITVKFRKKLLPVLASVANGVGGSILASDGRTCSTAKPCMMTPKKVDEKMDFTAVEASGFTVTKWVVYNDDNAATVYSGVKSISIPQMKKGVRILVQFGSPKSTCAGTIPPGFSPIYSVGDLAKLQTFSPSPQNYILCDDINLAGLSWPPLYLNGVFDGNNHSIANVSMVGGGFFRTVEGKPILQNSTIKNLGLVNASVETGAKERSDCGYNESAKIFGGGFAGCMISSSIINSYITGKVSDTTSISNSAVEGALGVGRYVGGLVGFSHLSTISNSYFDGQVLVSTLPPPPELQKTFNGDGKDVRSEAAAGGLVGGVLGSTILKSHASGSVNGDNRPSCMFGYTKFHVGGLVGTMFGATRWEDNAPQNPIPVAVDAVINNSYATSSVAIKEFTYCQGPNNIRSMPGTYLGGLVGLLSKGSIPPSEGYARISNSYARGNVSFEVTNEQGVPVQNARIEGIKIGGFAGSLAGKITNCYSTGTVSGATSQSINDSLIHGWMAGFGVWNSYSYTLNGYPAPEDSTEVVSSYYPTSAEPSQFNYGVANQRTQEGINYLVKKSGEGLTPSAMQQQQSYVGWDFVNTWQMPAGGGYPELR